MVKKIDTSGITVKDGDIICEGREAVQIYAVISLQSSMALNINTGMLPSRGWTKTRMRQTANFWSGSKAGNMVTALRDLVLWTEAATGVECKSATVLKAAGLER